MRARGIAAFSLFLIAAGAGQLAAATAPVSYLSGASVYVDAGAREGLAVGDTLVVLRGTREIARVRVTFASSHRAACDTLWTAAPIAVGDVVRYIAAPASAAAGGAPADSGGLAARGGAAPASAAAAPPARRARLRGRVGAGWLSVDSPEGGRFRQPSLALRFDGTGLGDGRADVHFDMRSRRTTRSFSGAGETVENAGRVYRAALTLRADGPGLRLVMGRQTSPTLASVSLFDGALLERVTPTSSYGVFAGTQPEAIRYGFSSDVVEGGAFVELHQGPGATERWSLAFGGVTSLDHGHPNRDFAFAQGGWFSKALTASFTQELDVNRSWKRANGEPLLSATSTFATASAPVTGWLALNAGYDSRRSVRLYRDRLTPETEFDDAYRRGAWVGAQVTPLPRLRLGGDTRTSDGAGRAEAWSLHAEAWRLSRLNGSLRARYSRFEGGGQVSTLRSFGGGFEPFRAARLDVSGGVRSLRHAEFGVDEHEHWLAVDGDLAFGRAWYLGAGWERDRGDDGELRQVQASLNRRF